MSASCYLEMEIISCLIPPSPKSQLDFPQQLWASIQRRNIATSCFLLREYCQSVYMGDEVGSVGMWYTDPGLCALNLPGKEAQNLKQEGIGCRQLCLRSTSM